MIILSSPKNNLAMVIKRQTINSEQQYRPCRYIYSIDKRDGRIIYNVMTKACVFLSKKEQDCIYMEQDPGDPTLSGVRNTLISMWFMVPLDFDEMELTDSAGKTARLFDFRNADFYAGDIVVMTTSACNARCSYCYEKGVKFSHMSEQTASDTADFLIKHYNGKRMRLVLFGGEPLVNIKAADIITSKLKEADVNYFSSIISNGYLFDEDIVRKSKELWKLQSAQITIDGTENVYNSVKNYVYPIENGSPFQKVMESIALLMNNDISVQVRLNVGSDNTNELIKLVDYLKERFGISRNLMVYTHAIIEDNRSDEGSLDDNRNKTLEGMKILNRYIWQSGMGPVFFPKDNGSYNLCMAAGSGGMLINNNGELAKCMHCVNYDKFGTIYDDVADFDTELIEDWKKQLIPDDKCRSCPMYPECHGLVKCPAKEFGVEETEEGPKMICFDSLRDMRLDTLRIGVESMYKKFDISRKEYVKKLALEGKLGRQDEEGK